KFFHSTATSAALFVLVGCSSNLDEAPNDLLMPDEPLPTGTGGQAMGTGGQVGTGGDVSATGGQDGTGGDVISSGGTVASGGMIGSGGMPEVVEEPDLNSVIPSAGCGMSAFAAEGAWTDQPALDIDGKQRNWAVRFPSGYDPNRAYPITFEFHGCG